MERFTLRPMESPIPLRMKQASIDDTAAAEAGHGVILLNRKPILEYM